MTACFICSFFIMPLNISLYCFKIVFIESLEGEPKRKNAGNADGKSILTGFVFRVRRKMSAMKYWR